MSVTRITSVHCDGCGVWEYPNFGETTTDLRRALRKLGWVVAQRKQDFCPTCSASRRENVEEPT